MFISYSPSPNLSSPETWTFFSPVPCKITSKFFLDKSLTGVCVEKPYSLATASKMREYQEIREVVLLQGLIAPSAKVKRGFGITKSGSTVSLVPKPLHSGQAPCGLLKEKSRGSNSERLMCPSGQANFWERIASDSCLFVLGFVSIRVATAKPSPKSKAFSKLSAIRPLSSLEIVRRSTTTSIVCFFCLSKFWLAASLKSIKWPSSLTRAKPAFLIWSKIPLCSPFWSFIKGASNKILVPSGKAKSWSVIAWVVWPVIFLPQTGQCGTPMRA